MSIRFLRPLAFVSAALPAVLISLAGQPQPVVAAGAGTLFGLGPSSIVTIDPASGATSTFVNLPTVTTFPGAGFGNLASDAAGHRLFTVRAVFQQLPNPPFFITTYQLVTINTQDPTAAPTVSPDMASGITQLVFDPSTQSLFGQTNTFINNTLPFQIVRIDPASGAQTHVADIPGVQPLKMTVAPAKHALYFATESFVLGQFQPVVTLVTVETITGALSQSPPLATGLFAVAYDTSSGKLFGKTFCCPASLVAVDPVTGTETPVAGNLNIGGGITIDSSSHTIFMTDDQFGAFGLNQFIDSVNDQTGARSISTGPLPANTFVNDIAFEGVAVTPESIKQDVGNALASGAIDNAGVANSLLAMLDAASAARSRGDCATAGHVYQAFINNVGAHQGGHIAAATAVQLISEAKFLIANCR